MVVASAVRAGERGTGDTPRRRPMRSPMTRIFSGLIEAFLKGNLAVLLLIISLLAGAVALIATPREEYLLATKGLPPCAECQRARERAQQALGGRHRRLV